LFNRFFILPQKQGRPILQGKVASKLDLKIAKATILSNMDNLFPLSFAVVEELAAEDAMIRA
jgi:hypothetical protein